MIARLEAALEANNARPLTITHVSSVDPSPSGGMGRIAYYWRRQFEQRGHRFVHVGPSEVGRTRHYSTFSLGARKAVRHLHFKPDVLLAHESAAWAMRGFDCPLVIFSHGLEARFSQYLATLPEERKWWKRAFARLYQGRIMAGLKKADLVLVSSKEDKNFLQGLGLSPERVRVFRNGVSKTGLAESRQMRKVDVPNVLFNASWIRRKGTGILVEAARILEKRLVRANWLLIGTGREREEVLSDWPASLRPAVTVVPHFKEEAEAQFLESADIFVLPSHFEGQPLALLQAMESGLPCLTTDCCGQRDVVVHGENGFLFPVGDASALARLLELLIFDEELRYKIGQSAARLREARSWAEVSDDVVGWVREAVQLYRTGSV